LCNKQAHSLFLLYTPEQVAEQMTLIDRSIFRKVEKWYEIPEFHFLDFCNFWDFSVLGSSGNFAH
jgi:hypothetical protein